ncbi:MAG TPA: peptidylprolyl isomerase [Chitinophagaceae bacterium]|nr:peptidylprolyl isomerase [Chitinophagaceae bacterium]
MPFPDQPFTPMLCRKIIFTLCGLMPAFIALSQVQPHVADKIVAVVGDQIVLSSEIKNSVTDLRRQGTQVPSNASCLAMEQAIISKLLMLQALKDSLPVTDKDVEAEMDQRLRYYFNQAGSEDDFAGKSAQQIKDDARESVKERMLADAMRQKITGGITISPAEVKSFFEKIPKDSLPFLESELEVYQIVFYPEASKDLEQYVINELNNFKKGVENKIHAFCSENKEECKGIKINRYNGDMDQDFLKAAFRLKQGEISAPVKCKSGFYLIQMLERRGDDATVRYVFRVHPVTDVEVNEAKAQLNVLRNAIIEKRIDFKEAASLYSENTKDRIVGPFLLSQDGSAQELKKDLAAITDKMDVGEISRPSFFVDEQNRKAVRLVYLKSRTTPHIMNLKDDYLRISQMALEEKRNQAVDKWINSKISSYFITIDDSASAGCPQLQRFASRD